MQLAAFPPFAPMNSTLTHNIGARNHRYKLALTVSLSLLASFNLLPVNAQSRNQKRITSLWTATTSAGSTVHVISDSSVNDYEAYTRGGRFYVKIPSADLPSARGSLLGRGFDDVQIQRYGDGIIISFHLQPGTTARVSQVGNRLEVAFTTPGRAAVTAAGSTDEMNRTRARRIADSAGPAPASTAAQRSARERAGRGYSGVISPSHVPSGRNESNRAGSRASGNKLSSGKAVENNGTSSSSEAAKPAPSKEVAAASPSPNNGAIGSVTGAPSPESVSSPGLQVSPIPQASIAAPGVEAKTEDNDWRSRVEYWKVWAQLNWAPILIGGVIVLALLVLLFFWRGAKRLKAATEPEPTEASSETVDAKRIAPTQSSHSVAPANAASAAAGSSQTHGGNKPQSSSTSSEGQDQHQGADPDREVFEL